MPAAPARTAVMTAFAGILLDENVRLLELHDGVVGDRHHAPLARLPSTAPPVGFESSSVTVSSPSRRVRRRGDA